MAPIPPEFHQQHQNLTPIALKTLLNTPITQDTDPFVVYCHAKHTVQQEFQDLTPEGTLQKIIQGNFTSGPLYQMVFPILLEDPNTLSAWLTAGPEQVFQLFVAFHKHLEDHPYTPQDIHILIALAPQHDGLVHYLLKVFSKWGENQPEQALQLLRDLPAPQPLLVVKLLTGAATPPEHHREVLAVFNTWQDQGHPHAVLLALPELHRHEILSQQETLQILTPHLASENDGILSQALFALDDLSSPNLDPFIPLVENLAEHPRWEVRLRLLNLRRSTGTIDFLPTFTRIIQSLARDADPSQLGQGNNLDFALHDLLERNPQAVQAFLVQWLDSHPEDRPEDLFRQVRFHFTLHTLIGDPAHLNSAFLTRLLTGPERHARLGQRLLQKSGLRHLTFTQALTPQDFRTMLNRLLTSGLDSQQRHHLLLSLASQVTDETRDLYLDAFTDLLMDRPESTHQFIQNLTPRNANEQQLKDHLLAQHQHHFPDLNRDLLQEFGPSLDRYDLYLHHHERWMQRIQQQSQAEMEGSLLGLMHSVQLNRGSGTVFFRDGKPHRSKMQTFQETMEVSRSRLINPELQLQKHLLRLRGEHHENRD